MSILSRMICKHEVVLMYIFLMAKDAGKILKAFRSHLKILGFLSCKIITFLPSLFSLRPPPHLFFPSPYQFSASFSMNYSSMHICIDICIPYYNLFSPYNAPLMLVFRTDWHWTVNSCNLPYKWAFFLSPSFSQLSIVLYLRFKSHRLPLSPVCHVCWTYHCVTHIWAAMFMRIYGCSFVCY